MCPTQKITTWSNYLFRPLAHPAPIQVHLRFRPLSVPVAGHDRTCGWMDPSCETTTRSAPGRRGRTPAVRSSSPSSRPAAVGRAARAGARMNNSGWTRLEYWNKRSPSNGSTGTVRVGRACGHSERGAAPWHRRGPHGTARPALTRVVDGIGAREPPFLEPSGRLCCAQWAARGAAQHRRRGRGRVNLPAQTRRARFGTAGQRGGRRDRWHRTRTRPLAVPRACVCRHA